jgi:hypothetical protein
MTEFIQLFGAFLITYLVYYWFIGVHFDSIDRKLDDLKKEINKLNEQH